MKSLKNKFPNELSYKMRAECIVDVGRAMTQLALIQGGILSLKVSPVIHKGTRFPDVTVEFTSALSLVDIRSALSKVVDGHVMVETVALAKDYTGKRGAA